MKKERYTVERLDRQPLLLLSMVIMTGIRMFLIAKYAVQGNERRVCDGLIEKNLDGEHCGKIETFI